MRISIKLRTKAGVVRTVVAEVINNQPTKTANDIAALTDEELLQVSPTDAPVTKYNLAEKPEGPRIV